MLNYAVLVVDTVLSPAFLLIFWQHTNEAAAICLNSLCQSDGHESSARTVTSPLPTEGQQGWWKGAVPIPNELPDALARYRSDGRRLANGCQATPERGRKRHHATQNNHFQNKAKILWVLSSLLFVIASEDGKGLSDQMGPEYIMKDTAHCTGTRGSWEQ